MRGRSRQRLLDALGKADSRLGKRVEQAIVSHHRRRLRRIGQLETLDTPPGGWAGGDPPPRSGCELELLVDGGQALARIAEAIEQAESSLWLAGLVFTPGFRLRFGEGRALRELLAGAAERLDVRVLAWAGAPLPLFHPDRREVRRKRGELTAGTRIACALDGHERPFHCHHEKLVIVDGRLAFVGGIDLTSYAGDRLDTSEHPARGSLGWHDATTVLSGPVVADVAEHFRLRWREVTGEALPQPPVPASAGERELQVVRTVPERIYRALPRGDFRILESYLRAFRSADRLIYLENQFLWSPEIVAVLAQKLRHPPSDGFRLLVVLPAKPNNGRDDTRGQLGLLAEADDGRGRLLACSLWQKGPRPWARPVYVHAKIGIVDDRWLTVGSANLNEHSLFNDSEMNVCAWDEELARSARLRLWSEHLERDAAELTGPPAQLVDELWRPLAEDQLGRYRRGEPLTHRLMRLPQVSRRANALRGPIDGLIVDG